MGLVQFFVEIFESIFKSSSPEVKKKQALRKLENELKSHQPEIYKNDMLLPNFGELIRILYENSRIIGDILQDTICGEDLQRNARFEMQLLMTGFNGEAKAQLKSISYEKRKQEVMDSSQPMNRVFEEQHHTLEALGKALNSPDFIKIDEVIAKLQQVSDICRFSFITILHHFDPDYNDITAASYTPNYKSVPLDTLAPNLQDLYYLTSEISITGAVARAVIALEELRTGTVPGNERQQQIQTALSKINSVFKKVLTTDLLKKLICLGKREPDFNPQFATYKANTRQKFAEYTQRQFTADENRIKTEIKDYTISTEISRLFNGAPMLPLEGYNTELNLSLQQNTSYALEWITPLQIVKTFINRYLGESIQSLLNDIVIEGFFSNNSYKTEFSTLVYTVSSLSEEITKFEKSFDRNNPNDKATILSYIHDSHRDQDFMKKLGTVIDGINSAAHQLIQRETTTIATLHSQMQELLTDAKKSKPDIVNNIKVLLAASRNRDNTGALDQQFEMWQVFLAIMKNYVIIGATGKKP
ncbi:MAG: DUF5312 family protein [Treponema sp.]|nr:DUF5312 family protein [Treponema sp.]